MSKNIEREEKALLNKNEYDALINFYQSNTNKIYEQRNYYLCLKDVDPKNFQYALRIRIEKETITATLKIDLNDGKLEINQDMTNVEFETFLNKNIFPVGDVSEYLTKNKINTNNLYVFAILINYRLDINYKSTLISIDKSEYLDNVDYEIECEATSLNRAQNALKEFLNNKNIPFRRNTLSKLKRVKNTI